MRQDRTRWPANNIENVEKNVVVVHRVRANNNIHVQSIPSVLFVSRRNHLKCTSHRSRVTTS